MRPQPRVKGICPLCEGKVISKCGEVNVWHWAHLKDEGCEQWYEPETSWHSHWKLTFGKEHAEIVITKDGKRHIADVFTNENVVIEIQNSRISKPTIRKREEFYGKRMLWLINGLDFKKNFDIYNWNVPDLFEWERQQDLKEGIKIDKRKVSDKEFYWTHARQSWSEVQRDVFIDFGDSNLFWVVKDMGTSLGYGRNISKEKFIRKYGGNYQYFCQHNTNRT